MTKQELIASFKAQIGRHSIEVERLEKLLWNNSILRLVVFFGTAAIIYFFWSWGNPLILVFFLGAAFFLQLVKRQLNLQYQRDFTQQLVIRNKIELDCQLKDFQELESGDQFNDGDHDYCQDIDLFGKGSFFQYMNRTSLVNGKKNLAALMKSNHLEDIEERQKVVRELSEKNDWRQAFWAEAGLVKVDSSPEEIMEWINSYKSFIPPFWKNIIYFFSAVSILTVALFSVGIIPEGIIVLWFLLGLIITANFVQRINTLSSHSSRSLSTFEQYSKLFLRIEAESWKAPFLSKELERLENDGKVASKTIGQFAKFLNALDQRSNIFIAVFSNGLFLRDIFCALRVEKWISDHHAHVRDWFEVIDYFDVQNSLANFHYNHPAFVFPMISSDEKLVLKASELGHPLLSEEKRIDNDFSISNESFFIVTGANMAGKSTFLRTVSLAIVMSNIALPVCAKSAVYKPIKLVSSMRTSDSLSNDESYFFSELKRLRYIIDKIADDKYFIILDEILKGTNSVDKAAGSKKFVERLVKSHSTGIIATHDLSLCETADRFDEVDNYFFDAQIIDDELYFDYSFKKGICQNMNASFLLKKMEIV